MDDKKKERIIALKFLLFSLSAGVIQFVSHLLLVEVAHAAPWIANYGSVTLSVLWNFTFNRKFTFKSANNVPIAMLKVAVFYVVFIPLSSQWTKLLTEPEYGICWNYLLVEILTMLANLITEFPYQRFFVFGKSLDTAKKKEKK